MCQFNDNVINETHFPRSIIVKQKLKVFYIFLNKHNILPIGLVETIKMFVKYNYKIIKT